MDKTTNIIIEETKQNIAKAIQDSKLPVAVLDMIIRDIYNEIHTIAIEVTTKEYKEYENSLNMSV